MGGHGAREYATNVGVMGARGDVEDYFVAVEGWCDNCDVGKMGATKFGMVGDDNISRFQIAFPYLSLSADAG